MNFFEHQDHARRQTGRMILLFILAVIVIVVAVNLSVSAILISTDRPRAENVIDYLSSINPVIYIVVSLLTLAIIGLGTMVRMAQLAKGGKAVAELVGARLITCDTSDLKEKMLLNVVEEMAIASGTAAPRVYVMDEERSINAFAAGYSPNEAIIAVTKGTLDILNRDELQGVIAHEFSHILNGDMRLNIRLLGVLNGILIIGTIGMYILRGLGRGRVRSNRDEGKGIAVMFLIGLSLAIIGYAGVFFGRLIKSAVSRQREYLADASAVQFTRNPTGIGGALKKILFGTNGSLVTNRHSEELSHMFFSQGIKLSFLSNLFSTHPPLEERIKRIDPSFNPRTRKAQEMKAEPGESAPVTGMATEMASSLANPANIGEDEIIHTKAKTVMSSIGLPSSEHMAYATKLYQSFPAILVDHLKTIQGASAVVYGLILDQKPEMQNRQTNLLRKLTDDETKLLVVTLCNSIKTLGRKAYIPLLDLAIPVLKAMSDDDKNNFLQNITALVNLDNKVSLFEYVVQTILFRHLSIKAETADKIKYKHLEPVLPDSAMLLSLMAYSGTNDWSKANKAFKLGMNELGVKDTSVLDISFCSLPDIRQALDKMRILTPLLRMKVVNACATTVLADDKVMISEAELLRAVSESLDCPMPPILSDSSM